MRLLHLNALEQRYVATCFPLPDRPGLSELETWRQKLSLSMFRGPSIDISLAEIVIPFPHLAMLARKGFFDERSVLNYFEGLDQDGHNMRMYLFAKRLLREKEPHPVLESVIEHIDACSTRVANIDNGVTQGYATGYSERIDTNLFSVKGPYVFLHGKTAAGLTAIRSISEEEYALHSRWWADRRATLSNRLSFENE